MSQDHTKKPKNVDYFQVPKPLWKRIKKLFPKTPKQARRGRPPAANRAVLNGIWYVLWIGCQWKAVHKDWFGALSSVLHQRFQTWQEQEIFRKIMKRMLKFYNKRRKIKWKWQALDSKSCPAPLGGSETGKNPTDRAKRGAKLHLLVDQRGAPLAVYMTAANQHDKCAAKDLLVAILSKRPDNNKQHLCADKGYDSGDVRDYVEQAHYMAHIKQRRRRGETPVEDCPIPGETRYPARRWLVERSLSWLTKRRSIRLRWCKKFENWKALIHFACAHVLFDLAFYG